MTTYMRVIPRDLFNESKLLKCMGQLALLIHDGVRWPLRLEFDDAECERFQIEQDQDGNLSIVNLDLYCGDTRIYVSTRYNSKDAFPLVFCNDEGELGGDVFTYDGHLHSDFILYLNSL